MAEREFKRKSDKDYEKNRDRMEAVYQTDKLLRKTKRKAQKLGMDIRRNAKKGKNFIDRIMSRATAK